MLWVEEQRTRTRSSRRLRAPGTQVSASMAALQPASQGSSSARERTASAAAAECSPGASTSRCAA